MVLSDATILEMVESGKIGIEPFDERMVQPASVDLRLSPEFMVMMQAARTPVIEPLESAMDAIIAYDRHVCTRDAMYYYLYPGQFVLGATIEKVSLPDDIVAHVEAKSSLSRCGLVTSLMSGYISPGFEGKLTIALTNATDRPIKIIPGMAICQLYFEQMDKPASAPYGDARRSSRYQGQDGPTPARFSNEELLELAGKLNDQVDDYIDALEEIAAEQAEKN